MKLIDLHSHSTCSDGTLTPRQLVAHAGKCGLAALALTDHDTTDGLAEAEKTAEKAGIELVPGIEFSTEYQSKSVHIVGLDINWRNPVFQERVRFYRRERLHRNQKIIDLMAADGIDISYEKMCHTFGDMVWTRANFGRYLVSLGYVRSVNEAFEKYLGSHCKYYVPREKVSPTEVIRLIRLAGGIPILAHPFQYRLEDEQLRKMLRDLKSAGLIGMELYYSTHSPQYIEYLLPLLAEFDLAPSGGSDFHGANKPAISLGTGMDNLHIPYTLLENLRKKAQEEHINEIS